MSDQIKNKVKEIISSIANIPVAEIGDRDAYVDDLGLDSLSLLEIGVDLDYEYKLGVAEESWHDIRCVDDAVALIVDNLPAARVA